MFKSFKLPALQARERMLAVGSGVVLMIVVMDRLVLGSWMAHQNNIREEVQILEETLQRYSRLLSYQERVISQLDPYRKYLRPPLENELQMAAFIEEIEGLASLSRVGLNEVKPLAIEEGEFSKQYSMDVMFECTLEEWVDFIVGIESSTSLYEIVRSSLAIKEDIPDRLVATLRVVSASVQIKGSKQLTQLDEERLEGSKL